MTNKSENNMAQKRQRIKEPTAFNAKGKKNKYPQKDKEICHKCGLLQTDNHQCNKDAINYDRLKYR